MTAHIPQIGPQAAWDTLSADKHALLVDVRTQAEWQTGVPATAQKTLIEWVSLPLGQQNPEFLSQLQAAAHTDTPLLFMCKAGMRSQSAAQFAAAHGFTNCHNIAGGMAGNGADVGWVATGLPVEAHV